MSEHRRYAVNTEKQTITIPVCTQSGEVFDATLQVAHQFRTKEKNSIDTDTYVVYIPEEILSRVYDCELPAEYKPRYMLDAVVQIKHQNSEKAVEIGKEDADRDIQEVRRTSEIYKLISQYAMQEIQDSGYVKLIHEERDRKLFAMRAGIPPDHTLSSNVPNASYYYDEENETAVSINLGVRDRIILPTVDWEYTPEDRSNMQDTPEMDVIKYTYSNMQMTRKEFFTRKEDMGKSISLFEILANLYKDINAYEKGFANNGIHHGDLNWENVFRTYSMVHETFGDQEYFNTKRIIPGVTFIDFESASITKPELLYKKLPKEVVEQLIEHSKEGAFYMTIGLVPADGKHPSVSSDLFAMYSQYANLLTGRQPYRVPLSKEVNKPVQVQALEYFAGMTTGEIPQADINLENILANNTHLHKEDQQATAARILGKVGNILLKGTSARPAYRYKTCQEAKKELEEIFNEFKEDWTPEDILGRQDAWKGIHKRHESISDIILDLRRIKKEECKVYGKYREEKKKEYEASSEILQMRLENFKNVLDNMETSDFAANNIYQIQYSLLRQDYTTETPEEIEALCVRDLKKVELDRLTDSMRRSQDLYGVMYADLETYKFPALEAIKVPVHISEKRWKFYEGQDVPVENGTVLVKRGDFGTIQMVDNAPMSLSLNEDLTTESLLPKKIDPREQNAAAALIDGLETILDDENWKWDEKEFSDRTTKISFGDRIISLKELKDRIQNPELADALSKKLEQQDIEIKIKN